MNRLEGFTSELFDYFICHDDETTRKFVVNFAQQFAEQLQLRLFKLNSFFDGYDIGRLEKKHTFLWIGFGPKGEKYRDLAHLTIVTSSAGIEVLANIELKPAVDKLRGKINANRATFRKHVAKLSTDRPSWLRLEERTQKQASIYHYTKIAEIDLTAIKHKQIGILGFEYIEGILSKLQYPYISIRKLVSRNEILRIPPKTRGNAVMNNLVSISKEFNPIIEFINR